MLKTLPELYKSNWKDHVHKLVFAYNSTRNDATTFSPFQLMFGRSPRLPIDFMFNLHPDCEQRTHSQYVDSWKKAMREACIVASGKAKKCAAAGKKGYDKKIYGATLEVGDRVLVRNMSERGGTGKLRSYWEEHVHVVISKKNDNIPVYTVERESGKPRVLHRNLLLPCDHLPLEVPVEKVVDLSLKDQKAQNNSSNSKDQKEKNSSNSKDRKSTKSAKKDLSKEQISETRNVKNKKKHKKQETEQKRIVQKAYQDQEQQDTDSEDSEEEELRLNRCRLVVDQLEQLLNESNVNRREVAVEEGMHGRDNETIVEYNEVVDPGVELDSADDNEVLVNPEEVRYSIDDESNNVDHNEVVDNSEEVIQHVPLPLDADSFPSSDDQDFSDADTGDVTNVMNSTLAEGADTIDATDSTLAEGSESLAEQSFTNNNCNNSELENVEISNSRRRRRGKSTLTTSTTPDLGGKFRRIRRPTRRLVYDEMGQPSYE